MVDTKSDTMYLHQPPANCCDAPNDVVPEWGLSASCTSLLPNIGHTSKLNTDKNKKNNKLLQSNIDITSHCKSSLLTLSFQVIQYNEIHCYLYWNGQMIRFLPSDMKQLLPRIFNMNWNHKQNLHFLNNTNQHTNIDNIMNQIKAKIQDDKFTAFRTWCKQHRKS